MKSRKISNDIFIELSSQIDGLMIESGNSNQTESRIENPEAYRLHLKGRYFFRLSGAKNVLKAIDLLQKSISSDPTDADVYLELADCQIWKHAYDLCSLEDVHPLTSNLVAKAESLKAKEHKILYMKGRIAMHLDWDLQIAKKHFERSINLDSGYIKSLKSYANLLANLEEFSLAMHNCRELLRRDPISARTLKSVSRVYYKTGQFEPAIALLNEALELEPNTFDSNLLLAVNYLEIGETDVAQGYLDKAETFFESSELLAIRGYMYAKAGDRDAAFKILKKLKDLYSRSQMQMIYLASIYAELKDIDEAIACIKHSVANREMDVLAIKVDPRYRNLRSDARFQKLVNELGLNVGAS